MSTAHETAALLPDPARLRARLRALAVLDATIGDDPRFCHYTFDYYERPVPLEAVRHVLARHPVTPAITRALNPTARRVGAEAAESQHQVDKSA
ncbi:hypothetical protein [Streptomyces sp. NPDC090036]|uniref:hypothetical protein n=1 Tax=Streptomyces sp. NPDC090036 TaxID=3365926 RepID=UPI0037F35A2F